MEEDDDEFPQIFEWPKQRGMEMEYRGGIKEINKEVGGKIGQPGWEGGDFSAEPYYIKRDSL